ncbi:PREDICTED: Protein of unknown function DUF789 [Prunus dulcis]|uniref:DUF789 family protein n=1 Tax=Prunus dulcis TaxID=3755 RepID=A0A5E4F946_PRUDU|nr:uncharacterized protein LOC117616169 [Prunus dulcis]VVA24654.1 PREDICTED: Protein of unknown function DUF789 [Prunus dulcis]
MSGNGGVSIGRTRGENRFYNPPAIRQRQQQQRQKLEQEKHQRQSLESDDCATSHSSGSGRAVLTDATNLDRFLEYTTPVVQAQYIPKTSVRRWRTHEPELHPYFVLGDLWESFKEWSAYGAGVPLLLNGSDSVIQYYVPYLSAIQLYVDPSKPSTRIRRPGDESDAESSRETSSDGSSDYGTERGLNGAPYSALSWQNVADVNGHGWNRALPRNKPFNGSSSDESGEVCNPPGQLIFQYMEHDQPFGREPLADKISVLASQFPELRTYRSCDLSPSSWVSVAWYPIYRIPTGPTLQSLDACFLTFHSLSTPIKGTSTDRLRFSGAQAREVQNATFKHSLPIFGLASYKFKVSFWNLNGVHECQKANSLLRAADNWLRLLQVNHPDFNFFVSHSTPRR